MLLAAEGTKKKTKRVPKGTSEYQSAWILDSDEEDEGEISEEDDDDDDFVDAVIILLTDVDIFIAVVTRTSLYRFVCSCLSSEVMHTLE